MRTYLTKQQIIDTLQSMPDIPVIVVADTDQIRCYRPEKIEIVKARPEDYSKDGSQWTDLDYIGNHQHPLLQDVILITY